MIHNFKSIYSIYGAFSNGSVDKEATTNALDAGDASSILGLGRSPEGGNSNPLQYPCLENPMNRGAWRPTVHRVAESEVTEHALCL